MRRDVFQAIADPTRRAILLLLASQALTPNEVAAHFSSSRQAVSKHLQMLTECELLTPQKRGREIYYQLNPAHLSELDSWISQLKQQWQDRFSQLDHLLHTLNPTPDET